MRFAESAPLAHREPCRLRANGDGNCHSLCSAHANSPERDTNSWQPYKGPLAQGWPALEVALVSRHKCVFTTDAADKLEFCKSRHGEAIIRRCSLLQSVHPSLSTSIVELSREDGSRGVECDLSHASSRRAAQPARTCRNFSRLPFLFHCSAALSL
jgi:hypothetical protein